VTPETPLERRAFRVGAVGALLLAAAHGAWVHYDGDQSGLLALLSHAGLALAFVGKFIVFAGLKEGAPSPWQLAATVFLLDIGFAFVLASGIETLERAPLLGRGLRRARARALDLLSAYPGLERRAFFGVALFVFLPLAGTGAITGSFLARIFGLSRADAVLAIALGSACTSVLFAALAHFVGAQAEAFLKNPVMAGIWTVVLLLVCWRAYLRVLSRLRT
jgi:uncharacterized membrane protein